MAITRTIEPYDDSSNAVVINNDTKTGNRGVGWFTKPGVVEAGVTYTFSCMVWISRSASVHLHQGWRSSETGGYTGWINKGAKTIAANAWTEYSYTFKPDASANLTWEFVMGVCFSGNANGITFKVAHAKLEVGDTATPWLVTNAAKTATNFLTEASSTGLMVHPSNDSTTGVRITSDVDIVRAGNVMNRISDDGMTLYNGSGTADTNVVAKFAEKLIELGKNSTDAIIKLCGGMGSIFYDAETKFLNLNSLRLSNYAKSNGTDMAASQVAAHFDTDAGANLANVLAEADASHTSVKVSATRPVSGGNPMQASIEPYATETEGRITFYADRLIFAGPDNATGTTVKGIYIGTKVVAPSNGGATLLTATEVKSHLGSGASQTNTVCIATNGDGSVWGGMVTGAMMQDGSAKAFVSPATTGSLRFNFVLIRFA